MENIHPAVSVSLRNCDIMERMIVIIMILTLQKYTVCQLWMEAPGGKHETGLNMLWIT